MASSSSWKFCDQALNGRRFKPVPTMKSTVYVRLDKIVYLFLS